MSEIEKLKEALSFSNKIIHDLIVGNQAAWIEWKHGKGAGAGMQWIENGLAGPGHIPGPNTSHYYKNAQLYHNEQRSDPLPRCPCGHPSSIGVNGRGYCCEEHQEMHTEKMTDTAKTVTERAIDKMKEA